MPTSHSSLVVSSFRFAVKVATLLIPTVFLLPFAHGQQPLGSMNGTVTDSSGAVVPDCVVHARSVATNLEVSTPTKNDGSFSIANLPIGTYEVKFTKGGFESSVSNKINRLGGAMADQTSEIRDE